MLKQGQFGGDAPRLHWLDALRGVAAMVVVLGHYYWELATPLMRTLFDPGAFGVGIFFMISGFIIPLSVRPDRPNATFRFAWARMFRLYPLYWLSVLFGAAVMGTGLSQDLANLTMVQRFIGSSDVIGVYWTLQIEFLFYVITALTIAVGRFDRVWLVAALAIGFATLAVVFGYVRFSLHLKAPMAVPIGLTFIYLGNLRSLVERLRLSSASFLVLAGIVGGLITIAVLLGFNEPWMYDEHPTRFLISYFLAVAVFLTGFRLGRFHLRFRVTAFFGIISYPIYLFHQPMLELMTRIRPDIHPGLLAPVAIGVTIVLSFALHRAIEMPAVQLGRILMPGQARYVAPAVSVGPS